MDKARETVLHWACKGKGAIDMVKLLLEHIKKLGDFATIVLHLICYLDTSRNIGI